ncbi:hypothetical protein Ccrd_011906 [Cynara cardunculus var. scolymus]|uniref:Uncharacterized protein n=1 Tax=Cynara cardunculus var. scolymus TaxID=59895 RepID=A0A103YIG2_CYNCS|nr:hypothetical protein Ccrd_011906 [Cynara cardunculus var. scolymus]
MKERCRSHGPFQLDERQVPHPWVYLEEWMNIVPRSCRLRLAHFWILMISQILDQTIEEVEDRNHLRSGYSWSYKMQVQDTPTTNFLMSDFAPEY